MRRVAIKDYQGQKFGKLTAICEVGHTKNRSVAWRFSCECGNDYVGAIRRAELGETISCGCIRTPDFTGGRFGKLLITGKAGSNRNNQVMWYYRCDCGVDGSISTGHLRKKTKNERSCGCIFEGKKSVNYKGYEEIDGTFWCKVKGSLMRGTKTIKFDLAIEDAWELYLQQDRRCALTGLPIGFRYSDGASGRTASLDRKDSAGPYTIGNVQWVHKHINQMKLDLSSDEFIEICRKITAFQER